MLPMHSDWTLEASDEEVSPPVLPRKEGAIALSSQSRNVHLYSQGRVSDELESLEWVGSCIFLVDHLLSCW